MVYFFGVVGFVFGFMAGQGLLFFLLRNVSREDLLNDKYLKWKYGTINWGISFFGAYVGISMYERFFS